MHIKKGVKLNGTEFKGYVDYGEILPSAKNDVATSASFIFATKINGYVKLPIGHILTNGCSTTLMTSLIRTTLTKLTEHGARVINITFDGLKSNFSPAKKLGANFDICSTIGGHGILHPLTGSNVYCTPDACHLMKLARNALEAYHEFLDINGNVIPLFINT